MSVMASQITGVSIIYSSVCSGADQRKPQSSASLSFVRGIHRWPVNSPHKGPVTRKMFPLDDVITMVVIISNNASLIGLVMHCMTATVWQDAIYSSQDIIYHRKYRNTSPIETDYDWESCLVISCSFRRPHNLGHFDDTRWHLFICSAMA